MGYSTLYGDTAGAFAPLGGVYKTDVFAMARWRNRRAVEEGACGPIPVNVFVKPPSAELAPDQEDEKSLGVDYATLDRILIAYVEEGRDAAAIVAAINNGDSSIALSADKIDLNGITTVADTLHIGSQNSLERKYLIFHKSGAVISATRGDLPELMLSAGKIDLCGELYHNGEPLNL